MQYSHETEWEMDLLKEFEEITEFEHARRSAPKHVKPAPLPSLPSRVARALDKIDASLKTSDRDHSYAEVERCWINKLRRPGADDRVIRWRDICTKGPKTTMSCDPIPSLDKTRILRTIRSVADVDKFGSKLGFITSLKSYFAVVENVQDLHYTVQDVLNANFVTMDWDPPVPRAYVSISEWTYRQMKNPNSVYSCFI
ncbi:MAG: hypothetical protein JO108_34080 [Acidobacteriaceae bacterium]|nr:hypothetical protein [Acidobacteriaceae bacterium]